MTPKSMDSLDIVEMVMVFEEISTPRFPMMRRNTVSLPPKSWIVLNGGCQTSGPTSKRRLFFESSRKSSNGPSWPRASMELGGASK